MQGLMYRLAELDADSAGLVRVIDYFDALVRHGSDTASLLRASAQLADCVVGIEIVEHGRSKKNLRRCDPRGQWSPEPQFPPSMARDITVDDEVLGRVWIERPGAHLPLDEMLVDRMALTAAIILQPRRLPTEAEHTRNLLFPMDELAVLTSCAGLGIEPHTPVRVVATKAVSDTADGTAHLVISQDCTPGKAAGIEADGEYLNLVAGSFAPTPELSEAALSSSIRAGISLAASASEVNTILSTARFARAQASATTPIVNAEDLGALNLLAPGSHIDHSRIPDLVLAKEIGNTKQGLELLETLRAYLQSGTLRAAADAMHLHHSSVAHRLSKLSQHVGFHVDTIENRARTTAMMLVLDGG
ncbi:helix-turn-helix domain-containing protein [Rhodococcus erythropolis]|uniref:PucR family transcriptional regulator n=1 Tax=Rhodococcus erythropolis TaxID=1833 RepID=UPI001E62EF8E|nr:MULTISPECIES: helix-turn-helix domain-containing protein [Rhodococcus erythropolis group]MCD2107163.1 helix-turn-helix domain-containing protein [Rhodococcus qingshengii]MCZ4526592.1 helix-turn-helix domain-containing protein [Rhodococcus erythropolis]